MSDWPPGSEYASSYGLPPRPIRIPPKPVLLREVCPATNTLLGEPIACDRGVGHTGPHMTRESWQWFDAPDALRGESDVYDETDSGMGGADG